MSSESTYERADPYVIPCQLHLVINYTKTFKRSKRNGTAKTFAYSKAESQRIHQDVTHSYNLNACARAFSPRHMTSGRSVGKPINASALGRATHPKDIRPLQHYVRAYTCSQLPLLLPSFNVLYVRGNDQH